MYLLLYIFREQQSEIYLKLTEMTVALGQHEKLQ